MTRDFAFLSIKKNDCNMKSIASYVWLFLVYISLVYMTYS